MQNYTTKSIQRILPVNTTNHLIRFLKMNLKYNLLREDLKNNGWLTGNNSLEMINTLALKRIKTGFSI